MATPLVSARVERTIAAPATDIWALIADVTRIGEFSPEARRAEWVGKADGPEVGARFKGYNELGKAKWTTKSTITESVYGRAFEFKVGGYFGPHWRYEFETTEAGTRVIETVEQNKPTPFPIRMIQRRNGVTDRTANLTEGMTTTLERIAGVAEAATHDVTSA